MMHHKQCLKKKTEGVLGNIYIFTANWRCLGKDQTHAKQIGETDMAVCTRRNQTAKTEGHFYHASESDQRSLPKTS